jgi:hypothetical protein
MRHPTRSQQLLLGMALIGLLAAVPALAQDAHEVNVTNVAPASRDIYWLFNRYWWLLFPLFWGISQMIKSILRHKRAQAALDVLQSYAAQGKEPPAELVAVLRQPDQSEEKRNRQGSYRHYGWIPVFLFGALACGFGLWAIFPPDSDVPRAAMVFVALIMVGLCLGNLVAMQASKKDQDRNPLQ